MVAIVDNLDIMVEWNTYSHTMRTELMTVETIHHDMTIYAILE